MNAHITVIIQYYLAFNSDSLLLRYYLVAVATAVCYSSILVSVTRSESMLCTRTRDWHV